mgnify:CR=1 FL=1
MSTRPHNVFTCAVCAGKVSSHRGVCANPLAGILSADFLQAALNNSVENAQKTEVVQAQEEADQKLQQSCTK